MWKEIKLLFDLIINPNETIRGNRFTSYDLRIMKRVFYISILMYSVLFNLSNGSLYNFSSGSLLIFIIMIVVYLSAKILILIYYFIFKKVGKIVCINYTSTEKLLLPLLILMLVSRGLISIFNIPSIHLKGINIMIFLWLSWIVYLILKHRLDQSNKRSIFISGIYPILNIIMYLFLY